MATWGDFDWTPAAIERLRVLWFDGHSARECGRIFGVSRNSIIGRIHRSGWSGMERVRRLEASKRYRLPPKASLPPPEPEKPPAKKRRLRPPAQLLKTEQPVSKPAPLIGAFRLMDLKHGLCRWPSDGDGPWTFCGAPQVEGSSYCKFHHQKAHHGASTSRYSASAVTPNYGLHKSYG
jgi:GcrA cell cycle regulator